MPVSVLLLHNMDAAGGAAGSPAPAPAPAPALTNAGFAAEADTVHTNR